MVQVSLKIEGLKMKKNDLFGVNDILWWWWMGLSVNALFWSSVLVSVLGLTWRLHCRSDLTFYRNLIRTGAKLRNFMRCVNFLFSYCFYIVLCNFFLLYFRQIWNLNFILYKYERLLKEVECLHVAIIV